MKKEIKVCIFQLDSSFNNLEKNIDFVKNKVKKHENEVDLYILNELFNTGYELDKVKKRASNLNEVLEELTTITREASTAFVTGSLAEVEDNKLYNTSYFISCGNILEKYRKIHLFTLTGENNYFHAGNKIKTFSFLGWDFGFSICYDLRFPEIYRAMREKGADIFLLPSNWPLARKRHWVTLSKARAIENQSFMIATNRVGTDNDIEFAGNSVVYSPWGENLMQMDKSENFDIIEISKETLNNARRKLDSFIDRRKDLYKY